MALSISCLCNCHPFPQCLLDPALSGKQQTIKEEFGFILCYSMQDSTKVCHHSSQSVHRAEAGTFVANGFGAGAGVQRGRGNRDIKGWIGNMQSCLFAFLWASLSVTWRGGIACGASSMSDPAARGELWWGVRVHCGAVVWAGLSCLRFSLRTWRGQERRESGRLQQTFSSLCALGRCEKEEGRKKGKTWWDEQVKLTERIVGC